MEHPPAAPAKLLEAWMAWERGEALPGRTMSTLKTGGLRILLERLVAEGDAPAAAVDDQPVDTGSWTPVV
ncbi:MAG TPA: hypothetical protein VFP61_08940 [Acidimicrobiales bacterium]|nr:hypothetical protein [Acidimicrobiales bacterium]